MPYKQVSTKWIIRSKPNAQAQARLFCFPYAGGGASLYRMWSSCLPADIEICAVQLPGREQRFTDPPYTQMAPLVHAVADALMPWLDRPYAIFGHSMGALIGFELAHICHQRHLRMPEILFASGCRAPQLPARRPEIHSLPDARFIEEVSAMNGVPQAILAQTELLQLILPWLRADFTLVETYHPVAREPLPCAITAFGGLQDAIVNQDEIAAWSHCTRGNFTRRMVPGDHFFLTSSQDMLTRALAHDFFTTLRGTSLRQIRQTDEATMQHTAHGPRS